MSGKRKSVCWYGCTVYLIRPISQGYSCLCGVVFGTTKHGANVGYNLFLSDDSESLIFFDPLLNKEHTVLLNRMVFPHSVQNRYGAIRPRYKTYIAMVLRRLRLLPVLSP